MKKVIPILIVCFLFAVNLLAQTPQYYNLNTGTSSNSFPFNVTTGKAVNSIFLAGEFNQPTPVPAGQQITKVYFRHSTTTARVLTNFHILMAQDVITTLTTGQFYAGPWDTVYFSASATLTATAGGWSVVTLDHPFPYDITKSLILFVGQCGASGSGGSVYNTSLTGIRRTWSVGGCPFTPYTGGDAYMLNFGIDVEPAIPTAPLHYNYMTTGSNNSFPFGIAGGKMVQWLIPAAGQTGGWNFPSLPLPGGMINAVYIWVGGTYPLGPTTYTNFEILMGQTNLTNLTTGTFYSGTMDTVFYRASVPLQGALNSWMPIALDNPVPYDPDLGLVLQIGQCAASGVTGYPVCQTTIGGVHRVWSVGGCPFTPNSTSDAYVIHTGINIDYPLGTNNNNKTPNVYKLEQNYPNPFNPVTQISYSIPKTGNVKLVVFDVLGREVATLVNEVKTPGKYSVSFDASNLSSGVYMYRIEAGDFTNTKKMMLVK